MGEKKRFYCFDYLRFFAMLGVVFMHCAAASLRADVRGADWHVTNALTSLAFSSVPLFFMMSGFLLTESEKRGDVSYLLRHRLPKLLIPLILYSAIATLHLLSAEGNLSVSSFVSRFATAGSAPSMVHFWFMYTLLGMYLISPVLSVGIASLSPSGRRYAFVLIAAALLFTTLSAVSPEAFRAYLPSKVFSELSFFGGHIASFALGALFSKTERKVPNLVLIAVAVATLIFITFMTAFVTGKNGAYTQTFQSQSLGFEILLASCIFLLAKQNINRGGRFLARTMPVTALAFPIYLLHNILLSIAKVAHSGAFYPETALGNIALTAVCTFVCFIILKTVASIKPLCFIFTGLSFDAASKTCNWQFTAGKIKSRFKKMLK